VGFILGWDRYWISPPCGHHRLSEQNLIQQRGQVIRTIHRDLKLENLFVSDDGATAVLSVLSGVCGVSGDGPEP